MKVEFKFNEYGVKIDEAVSGANADEIVKNLRTAIANHPMRVFFHKTTIGEVCKQAKKIEIDPTKPNAAANQTIFDEVIDAYNNEHQTAVPHAYTSAEFLKAVEGIGLAKVLEA